MKRKADPYEKEKERLLAVFNLEAPKSLFDLWDACLEINPSAPAKAVEALGLRLVGPFDLLTDEKSTTDNDTFRYFYDPPEFITCIISLKTPTLHWGLYRDSPNDLPCAVFENDSKIDCKFKASHRTVFGPLFDAAKKSDAPIALALRKLDASQTGPPGAEFAMRKKKLLGQTMNGFGVNVPYDKEKQVGYRELSVTQTQLKSILEKIRLTPKEQRNTKALEELINWVNIANDECDFGMGYELGSNLLCADRPCEELIFSKASFMILRNAYNLIGNGREVFIPVLEKLLSSRKALFEKFGKTDKFPGAPLVIDRN